MSYNNMFEEIKELITTFKSELEQKMPEIRNEVENIISSKSNDLNAIEHMCDTLLDLMNFGVGEKEFIQLLEYLKTINAESAAFYWNEYDVKDED